MGKALNKIKPENRGPGRWMLRALAKSISKKARRLNDTKAIVESEALDDRRYEPGVRQR